MWLVRAARQESPGRLLSYTRASWLAQAHQHLTHQHLTHQDLTHQHLTHQHLTHQHLTHQDLTHQHQAPGEIQKSKKCGLLGAKLNGSLVANRSGVLVTSSLHYRIHSSQHPFHSTTQHPFHPNTQPHFNTSNKNPSPSTSQRLFHTTPRKPDIPDYLKGNVSQVLTTEDDLDDEFEVDDESSMEEDIADFLTCHLVQYEENATSFTVQCPACHKDEASRPSDIFVDKHSGYFVCPWCGRAGVWEELMQLLNSREDVLSVEQLEAFLGSTESVVDARDLDLQHSPLKHVGVDVLARAGARVTADGARLVLPVMRDGDLVGVESVSTQHQHPLVVRRYLSGKASVFGSPVGVRSGQKVVVVPSCCDVLTLAQHNIPAVSLPAGNLDAVRAYIGGGVAVGVVVWLGPDAPPRPLLVALLQAGVSCSIIRSGKNESPIHLKSRGEIEAALKDTIPVLSSATTTFDHLRDTIYHRITHREETCGVQWRRYSELNELLLGHRAGELTVLTGPTGSGKTTFMAEYSLDLCAQGVRTLWGSFEVSVVRLCEVMLQQYSGTALPQDLIAFNTLAAQFTQLPLHFLTYHGQQTVASVIKAMSEGVQVWGIQHVVIDNLQFMLGTSDAATDRWWEQDRAVAAFRRFATTHQCHVTLIVHPRKVPDGQPLTMNSVFGGAKVTQEADNVLILQVKDAANISTSRKALQVVKNRYGGQLGVVPLKFHKESLTLSSCFRKKDKDKGVAAKQTREQQQQQQQPQLRQRVKGLSAFGF